MTASKASDSPDPHPSDDVLLALQEAEPGGTLDAERAHVDQCPHCKTRLRRQLTAAPPARVVPLWRRRAIMAASMLVVAIAMTAAAGPLRRWIAERMSPPPAPAGVVRPLKTSADSQRPASGPTLMFAVVGSGLVVRLDSIPAAGELTIEPAKTDKISARVSAGVGTGGDTMVVVPGELRLRNNTASRANYTLALPGDVARLRVIVAGRVVFNGSPPRVVRLTGH